MLEQQSEHLKRENQNIKTLSELETFQLFSFTPATNEFLASFNQLEDDKFLKKSDWAFRKRSFVKAIVKPNSIQWLDDYNFYQSRELNGYAGGIERTFPPAPQVTRDFFANLLLNDPAFKKLLGEAIAVSILSI